jgi:uncharacterized protein YkwD
MKTLLFLLIVAACTTAHAASPTSEELLASLKSRMASGEEVRPLVGQLEDMPPAELKKLIVSLERAWPIVKSQYLSALEKTSKAMGGGIETNKIKARIRELRAQFEEVYQLDENAMKPLLKSKSMPAVEELRKLMIPSADSLIQAGGASLSKARHNAVCVATFRDAVLNADLSTIPSDSMASLKEAEKRAAEASSAIDKSALRILESNAKIAIKEKVPEDETKGVEECNLWRLLVGLNACILDPKLCAAGRDHSKDMEEQGFFAHESPVAGKKTPWDRAARFKTSASGENIFMGSASHTSANEAWFFSPGHHKNMFHPAQIRIGLGQHNNHWTQLFGR